MQVLEETELPAKELFYSQFKGQAIREKDDNHAKRMWSLFNCKNLREHVELYMKIDVCLLAIIMEAFRRRCMAEHELEICNYFFLPGYSLDCGLKITGAEIDH